MQKKAKLKKKLGWKTNFAWKIKLLKNAVAARNHISRGGGAAMDGQTDIAGSEHESLRTCSGNARHLKNNLRVFLAPSGISSFNSSNNCSCWGSLCHDEGEHNAGDDENDDCDDCYHCNLPRRHSLHRGTFWKSEQKLFLIYRSDSLLNSLLFVTSDLICVCVCLSTLWKTRLRLVPKTPRAIFTSWRIILRIGSYVVFNWRHTKRKSQDTKQQI